METRAEKKVSPDEMFCIHYTSPDEGHPDQYTLCVTTQLT